MTKQEKKQLSEIDICDLFITPAIKDAGWNPLTQIRREVTLTGTKAKRDYVFTLAVNRTDLGERRLFSNQRVGAIRPFRRELVPLINVFLKTDELLDRVFATATGTANQANIGTSSILDLNFPLPPLAEQRRIVAKVEQLMALVDALETQLAAGRVTASKLLAALVAELTGTKSTGQASKPAPSGPARRGRPRKST